ncbi:MAG TPA: hypothetical protein VK862_08210 [Afifellaceae bacterium]|nr:hypothetical protein [Afifellaceae bacterium]
MTKPAVTKLIPYAVALTLVSAAAATLTVASAGELTVASAGDMAGQAKDQSRHPDIAALAGNDGKRHDVQILPIPGKARDVIIVLPDGRHLVQRYYPSGYSVVFKPESHDGGAAAAGSTGELAQLDRRVVQ